MSSFQKATKKKAKARVALIGPSGAGKTRTALEIGRGLGSKIAVIDTESGSASKYSDKADFDVLELESFSPQNYIDAIVEAGKAGYDVLIIDSLSHAWSGKGGALELVDAAAKRGRGAGGNSFGAWREVTPLHNRMVDAIVRAPMHVIATIRAKTEYVQEKDERTGKVVVRKVGLQPEQRGGLEYEFDVVADINQEHDLIVSKTRCDQLDGAVVNKAGVEFATRLRSWLEDGQPEPRMATVTTFPSPKSSVAQAPEVEEVPVVDETVQVRVSMETALELSIEQSLAQKIASAETVDEVRSLKPQFDALSPDLKNKLHPKFVGRIKELTMQRLGGN